jgi:[citrate (pro-3S)-lyase] ligase
MHQGEGLTAHLMTAVRQEAFDRGIQHLMLFTKPGNLMMFREFGFHPVIRTDSVLLMENRRNGLSKFLSELDREDGTPVGCIVANCNPFTLGHRYLIETAAKECAQVHVFVLSEDRGMFSAKARLQMVKEGCKDLANVHVHPSGPYMVSSATFPSYFLKDKHRTGAVHCELDVKLFAEKIAPALGVTRRYVGTEPNCAVTAAYNAQMKQLLPEYGIGLIEVERRTLDGQPVSASRVRQLIEENRLEEAADLLPAASKGAIPCLIPTECKET